MSVVADRASQLGIAEARLGVQFPAAFRDASREQRAPKTGSRYILLPLEEIETTHASGVPGNGVVVARSIAGGYVIFTFARDHTSTPRLLNDAPLQWEPADGEDGTLSVIGDSFDDVLDPERFEKSRLCPHCGSDDCQGSPCRFCGRRRGERPAQDPDRDIAGAMVRALVESGEVVTRSARSTDRIIYATTEILHRVDDDAIAAAEIIQIWEDAPEVEEVFIGPEELAIRFLATR